MSAKPIEGEPHQRLRRKSHPYGFFLQLPIARPKKEPRPLGTRERGHGVSAVKAVTTRCHSLPRSWN